MGKIHDRIKSRRKNQKISVDDVAKELGVSRATIYRYENAEIEKIPVDVVDALAKLLRTSKDYLLGNIDDPEFKVIDMNDSFTNLDNYRETYKKIETADAKSEAVLNAGAEERMLIYLYGMLTPENKVSLIDHINKLIQEQKGDQ